MTGMLTTGPRLLPRSWRWPAASVAGAAGLGATVLGLRLHGVNGAGGLDDAVDPLVAVTDPTGRLLLRSVVAIADPPSVLVLMLVVALLCVRARRGAAAVLAVLGPGVAAVATQLALKPLVGRTLEGSGAAFPSGHATAAAALAAVVVVVQADRTAPSSRTVRAALVVGSVTVACAVLVSLVGLQLHYSTDAVGGAMVGTAVVLGLALLLDAAGSRRRPGPGG